MYMYIYIHIHLSISYIHIYIQVRSPKMERRLRQSAGDGPQQRALPGSASALDEQRPHPRQLSGISDRGTWGSPRFPLKGSFKGDIDIGIDMDVDIDIALDARGT